MGRQPINKVRQGASEEFRKGVNVNYKGDNRRTMAKDLIQYGRTPNGIPVIIENISSCESMGCMVAVGTGSRDETPDIFGLSHLLEHTVFRETKTRDSYEMAKEMEGAGGYLNAFTGREMTAFYGLSLADTRDVAMKLVGDIVANPMINKKDVELEKKIVLQELDMIRSEPDSYIHDLAASFLWRGHALSQDEGRDPEIVRNLGPEELRKYYDERYGIPNMAVFAAGAVDLEETVHWASETFDSMGPKKKIVRTAPSVPEKGYNFVKGDADHCQIALGFPAFKPGDELVTPGRLLAVALGGGSSSRLFQEVREKRALVYSIYSGTDPFTDASAMVTNMSCMDKNVIESVKTTVSTMCQLKKEGIDEDELQRCKNILKGALVRDAEKTERRLERLCNQYTIYGRCHTLRESLDEVAAVTADQVMEAAEKILNPAHMNLTVLGKGNKAIQNFDIESLVL